MNKARSTALTAAAAALSFGALFAVAKATDGSEAPDPSAPPAARSTLAVGVAPLGTAAPLPALRLQVRAVAPAPEPKSEPEPSEAGTETATTTPVAPEPAPTATPTPTAPPTPSPTPPREEPGVTFDDSG
jgi:hypothetical protein